MDFLEELQNRPHAVGDGFWRQPAFSAHVLFESGNLIGVWLSSLARIVQSSHELQPTSGIGLEVVPEPTALSFLWLFWMAPPIGDPGIPGGSGFDLGSRDELTRLICQPQRPGNDQAVDRDPPQRPKLHP